jgi:ectoine hydroxylase-related dioxygenase (phytanoyl-CoA dioxygenase family)
MLTAAQVLDPTALEDFERDGYLIVRSFLTGPQVAALQDAVANDTALRNRAYEVGDGGGTAIELALWNEPGDDSLGALARNERLVGAAAQLLGDEVYHYHTKLNSKRPGGGGTWVWHQDYGYWYENSCLFPEMLSVGVPLTPQTTDSGCLELLRGSHRAGRIEHGRIGGQAGADPERVALLAERLEQVSFLAEPGDVLFFHCNTLHRSSPNRSTGPRDLLLVAYNTRRNDPPVPHHHPQYAPIDVLADSAIEERAGHFDGERRTFMQSRADRSTDRFEQLGNPA